MSFGILLACLLVSLFGFCFGVNLLACVFVGCGGSFGVFSFMHGDSLRVLYVSLRVLYVRIDSLGFST